ncbi:MAG: hypothetical protein JSS02_26330 [Planctomycetes bacterium]|nr:hypothetical protein [Planctomycetota bacterium]
MGDDFRNRQCYAAGRAVDAARLGIQQTIVDALTRSGYSEVTSEAEAMRSVVIGPIGRWIFVGDTAGSTDDADPVAFDALTLALSDLLPVVDIQMSDTAAVHISLYKDGSLIDKFGNAAFPFFKFRTDKEAAEFRGRPGLWAEYLVSPLTAANLRTVWVQGWGAEKILSDSARLFGWDADLSSVGYTLDSEGIGIKYNEFLSLENAHEFKELHFRN